MHFLFLHYSLQEILIRLSDITAYNLRGASWWSPPSWWPLPSEPQSPPPRSRAAWLFLGRLHPRPWSGQRRQAAGRAARSPPVFPDAPQPEYFKYWSLNPYIILLQKRINKARVTTPLKFLYHYVLLVSLLLDVFVCSLNVLNVHRTELA